MYSHGLWSLKRDVADLTMMTDCSQPIPSQVLVTTDTRHSSERTDKKCGIVTYYKGIAGLYQMQSS